MIENQLLDYANLLLEWNKTHALTALKDVHDVLNNCYDALGVTSFLEPFSHCLDVGSGNGLPAIPLALFYPHSSFILCEPIKKKVAFLNVAKLKLGLHNVTILNQRVEHVSIPACDLITSRAVTDSSTLIRLTHHLTHDNTRFLFYKGSHEETDKLSAHYFPRDKGGVYVYGYMPIKE